MGQLWRIDNRRTICESNGKWAIIIDMNKNCFDLSSSSSCPTRGNPGPECFCLSGLDKTLHFSGPCYYILFCLPIPFEFLGNICSASCDSPGSSQIILALLPFNAWFLLCFSFLIHELYFNIILFIFTYKKKKPTKNPSTHQLSVK